MKRSNLKIKLSALAIASVVSISTSFSAFAEQTLFTNVNVFNGTENKLYNNLNVLVEDKLIKSISSAKPATEDDATVIDGAGKTLMPGLIDGHVHIMINSNYDDIIPYEDPYDLGIKSAIVAKDFLMDGFTSIRDMGGPAFAVARQIKNGTIIGPRIYPSGSFISQTSGHGDFRGRFDLGWSVRGQQDLGVWEKLGFGSIADGVPEVLEQTRINLRHGATQIKIMAGGGGSSKYDPIDTTQYSVEETCAIVEAAKDWGTYVAAHIFTDRAINRALDCGVKTMEHGFFASFETYQRLAKEGGFVVPQMWGLSPELMNNPLMPKDKLPLIAQLAEMYKDVGRTMLDAGVKVSFMSDWVGEIENSNRSRRYEIYWRTVMFGGGKNNYDGNFEVLKQLTSIAGEMLALSGPRNPAPGPIGVIEVGATADILLVDGNPLEDIHVINGGYKEWYSQPAPSENPIETIQLIMKEGKVYKNTL
ncbi:amidohydrolase family protein [Thalassotalea nanhaiensis]|uniref:Amidohydrolase family protein n=1 Tax=Thalassotalea nanhaiensis TaxID=3065648 RepID=A0ABY9TFB8_9GAMM|nr:amidohydrolase family protein [Colwelliaceae bacterium SQ345]